MRPDEMDDLEAFELLTEDETLAEKLLQLRELFRGPAMSDGAAEELLNDASNFGCW